MKLLEKSGGRKSGKFKDSQGHLRRGIPCFMRGYYHRALLYFFGPYIEISLLVPEDKSREAEELIKQVL